MAPKIKTLSLSGSLFLSMLFFSTHLVTSTALAKTAAIPVAPAVKEVANAATAPKVEVKSDTQKFDLAKQESNVEFLAVGKPSLIKINGSGAKLQGSVEISPVAVNGTFVVQLKELTTKIDMRDDHMKNKYLEVEKYPMATLVITDLKIEKNILTAGSKIENQAFTGKLMLHGQESEVKGTFTADSGASTIDIVAQAKTSIQAHKIEIPSYMGIKVADDIEFKVTLNIKKQ